MLYLLHEGDVEAKHFFYRGTSPAGRTASPAVSPTALQQAGGFPAMSYLLLAVYSCIHTCIHAQHYHHAYKNITSLSHASCTCMHTPTHLVMHLAMHSPTRGTPTWVHACGRVTYAADRVFAYADNVLLIVTTVHLHTHTHTYNGKYGLEIFKGLRGYMAPPCGSFSFHPRACPLTNSLLLTLTLHHYHYH